MDQRRWSVLLVAISCLSLSSPAIAEPLSISRKTEIPLYQEKNITRAAITGAVSGLAIGAGAGFGFRQMMCRHGDCPSTAKTVVPSLLVGGVVGAGVGVLVRKIVGRDSSVVVFPTVGIGSHGSAPALMFEGHF